MYVYLPMSLLNRFCEVVETTDGALVLALLLPVEVFPEECLGGLGSLC